MKDILTVTQAAKELGIPRRSMYSYLERDLLPFKRLSEKRIVLTREQVNQIAEVLENEGRQGIRKGFCLAHTN